MKIMAKSTVGQHLCCEDLQELHSLIPEKNMKSFSRHGLGHWYLSSTKMNPFTLFLGVQSSIFVCADTRK
jgi:hypothetical protein